MGFQLQDRDVHLLNYLYDMRYSTKEDLYRMFFRLNKNISGCRSRIYDLRHAGLISGSKYAFNPFCYFITRKGHEILEQTFFEKNFEKFSSEKRVSNITHTLKCSEIRSKIDFMLKIEGWKSERSLKVDSKLRGEKSYIPDGVFSSKGSYYIFEYERTQKSYSKMKRRILDVEGLFTKFEEPPIALFVSAKPFITKNYKKLTSNPNFIFINESNLTELSEVN